MKLYWTIEAKGVWLLRDEKTAPRAIVAPRILGDGYAATILEPGMPGRGPFKFRRQAAQWCEEYVKREMFSDAVFGDIPPEPGSVREQKELFG